MDRALDFRGKEFETCSDVIVTRVSSFPFSYFTWKETKLVLSSLAIVSLRSWSQMLFRKVQKRQQNVYGSKMNEGLQNKSTTFPFWLAAMSAHNVLG